MQKIKIFIFIICISSLAGCATSPYVKPTLPPPAISGIYHRVEKGQTLWRISKMYDVDLDELVRINRIQDATSIETGQQILIPNRKIQLSSPVKYASDDFIWPIKGQVIATFGQTFNNMNNKGINIRPYSNFDVIAAESGRVIFYSDNFGSFGKTIIIDHGNGLSTVYARNKEVYIKAADNVRKGMVISKAGSAGRDKNIYLHFEVRKGHIPQNPYYYLP
jgi:murein DD-endopeptidase MepM/ murein hydrolase activator NlpD